MIPTVRVTQNLDENVIVLKLLCSFDVVVKGKWLIYTSNMFVFCLGGWFTMFLKWKQVMWNIYNIGNTWKYPHYIPIRIYKIDKSFPNLETSCKNQEQPLCFEECVDHLLAIGLDAGGGVRGKTFVDSWGFFSPDIVQQHLETLLRPFSPHLGSMAKVKCKDISTEGEGMMTSRFTSDTKVPPVRWWKR